MDKKIKIVCDTISDLPIGFKNSHNLEVVPLKALLDDVEYYDGVDITNEEFYELLANSDDIAKTSQATYVQFKEVFERLLNEGYQILYVGGSSKGSGTFQSAFMASKDIESEDIHLYDTLNISLGGAIQVVKATYLAEKGLSIKEIITELEKDVENTKVMFSVDTLEYLKRGGRISSAQATIGSLLSIKPILTVRDGMPDIIGKCRGKKQVISKMVQLVKDHYDETKEFNKVLLGHGINKEDVLQLKEKLKDIVKEENMLFANAGLSTASHCGSTVFGLAFI